MKRIQADLALLLAAFIWGSGFVAQRVAGMAGGLFYYNGLRFLLGSLVLLPLVGFHLKIDKKNMGGVLLAGSILAIATILQQGGIRSTTAGNAALITGLYVILVPLILSVFLHRKLHWSSWSAALLGAAGTVLLSANGPLRLAPGDLLELAGTVFWSLHVIVIGMMMERMPALPFSIGQFAIAGLINLAGGLAFETYGPSGLLAAGFQVPWLQQAWWTILYTGILSIAIGYTLQAAGQRHAPPTEAAVIMSMEGVFAVLFGYLFLSELLSVVQLVGCVLILLAILLAQLRPTTQAVPLPD